MVFTDYGFWPHVFKRDEQVIYREERRIKKSTATFEYGSECHIEAGFEYGRGQPVVYLRLGAGTPLRALTQREARALADELETFAELAEDLRNEG